MDKCMAVALARGSSHAVDQRPKMGDLRILMLQVEQVLVLLDTIGPL